MSVGVMKDYKLKQRLFFSSLKRQTNFHAVPVRALCPVGEVIVLSLGWRNSLSSFVEGIQFLCF